MTDYLLAGRYRLTDRIAAGGMGEVWRGEDVLLNRAVAVKLLPTGRNPVGQPVAAREQVIGHNYFPRDAR